jgi:regulatory protein
MSGTVTALEVQKKNKERVSVYLDGEFAFGLSLTEAARLRKGQTLSDAEIAAFKAGDTIASAYERAVRFLGYRPRSTAEIRKHLADKETTTDVIETVIARLEEQGYLNDQDFARLWVKERAMSHPLGARALRFELKQKGIASDVIDLVLADLDTSEDAYRAAQSTARRFSALDDRTFRNKVGAFLTRRGFDYDVTRSVIERLLEERGSDVSDAFTGQDVHDTD